MNISRHVIVSILFLLVITFAGILYWPLIVEDILAPTALVLWLLLRIFVLSIDQIYYWGALIFIVLFVLFRLLPSEPASAPSGDLQDKNEAIETIEYWRSIFTLADGNAHDERFLRKELAYLVASVYATKQRASPNFLFYDALQRGELALPEQMRTFLFPGDTQETRGSVRRMLSAAREMPGKWIRRWRGQDAADHYQMIDEVLGFVEASLEVKNDTEEIIPNEH
jgi:hypothetical protein